MELDDLRGRWQAQPHDVTVTQPILQQVQPGLIEKMRRNAQWELALTVVTALGLLILIALADQEEYRLWGALMLLLAGTMLFYHYQKLVLLRRMACNGGSVQGHLETLYEGVRVLLRFRYELTLATNPTMLVLMIGYRVSQEFTGPGSNRWALITGVVSSVLILLLIAGAVHGARWYLQNYYGKYLDQLEEALRELRD